VDKRFAEQLGSDVIEQMHKAKATVENTQAVERTAEMLKQDGEGEAVKPQSSRNRTFWAQYDAAQQAELFVGLMAQSAGQPFHLDAGLFPGDNGQQVMQQFVSGQLHRQALGGGTDSKGGYLIPDEFIPEIEKRAEEPAVIWPIITKRPTRRDVVTKAEITAYPTANTGDSANSSSTTTSDDITETEPTFGELTWTMRYMDARFLTKLDLLDDSPIAIMSELSEVVGDAFSEQREALPLTGSGSGSSEPAGILNDGDITTVAIDAALTVDNLLDFNQEIPQRYRGRAHVIMSATNLFTVASKLAQNINAPQFLQQMGALPPMLESANMPDNKLLGGDFRRYVVYHNTLMRMVSATVPKKFSLDTVIVEKWDGQVTLADAFRIGTGVSY
jgi:HK97 family phage major capsid protein